MTENGTTVPLEEGHQNSFNRQVEIPKIGLSEIGLTDPVMNPEEPPKKMSCFELSDHSSNTWEIDSDCTNKCVKLLCRIRY